MCGMFDEGIDVVESVVGYIQFRGVKYRKKMILTKISAMWTTLVEKGVG